mgnify:CR=1 FL=1
MRMESYKNKNRLVITCEPSFASAWLVPRLNKFKTLNPSIEVLIDSSPKVVSLSDGSIDLAIRFGTDDLEKSGVFYDKVFKTIGVVRHQTTQNEVGYGKNGEDECFWIIKPFNEKNATHGNGTQMIITAETKEQVDLFYKTAINSGGLDEGGPGLRDHTPNYYGAYIRDLDGNKIHIYTILN